MGRKTFSGIVVFAVIVVVAIVIVLASLALGLQSPAGNASFPVTPQTYGLDVCFDGCSAHMTSNGMCAVMCNDVSVGGVSMGPYYDEYFPPLNGPCGAPQSPNNCATLGRF